MARASSNMTANDIIFKPVTTPEELPELVDLCMRALETDGWLEWVEQYTEHSEREQTTKSLNEALADPSYSVVKAVLSSEEGGDDGKVVGYAHWKCGYIMLDKVDPFAPKSAGAGEHESGGINKVAPSRNEGNGGLNEATHPLDTKGKSNDEAEQARRLKFRDSVMTDMGSSYVGTIRGKKHMYIRNLMIDPAYQRRGIGSRLLKRITDEADQQNIVCWLFARPASEGLYRRFGFRPVHITPMNDGSVFHCSPTTGMLRKPRSITTAATST